MASDLSWNIVIRTEQITPLLCSSAPLLLLDESLLAHIPPCDAVPSNSVKIFGEHRKI
jgi:hypothetical protein